MTSEAGTGTSRKQRGNFLSNATFQKIIGLHTKDSILLFRDTIKEYKWNLPDKLGAASGSSCESRDQQLWNQTFLLSPITYRFTDIYLFYSHHTNVR